MSNKIVTRRRFVKGSAASAVAAITGLGASQSQAVPSKAIFNTFFVYYNAAGEVTFKHKYQTLTMTPLPAMDEWHVFHLAQNPDGVDIGGVVTYIQFETIDNPESGNHVVHRRVELLHMRRKPDPAAKTAAISKGITGEEKYCIKESYLFDDDSGVAEGEWVSVKDSTCAGPSVRSGLLASAFDIKEETIQCAGEEVAIMVASPKA